jgi:YggT family protein
MGAIYAVARLAVFAAFSLSLLVAVAAWAVRARRVSPFSPWGRALRSLSDPVLEPIERTLVRAGSSPQHAGWWLVIGVACLGVFALTLVEWIGRIAIAVADAAVGGPVALAQLAVGIVYEVLVLALIIRVVGSWFGVFRYNRGMRLAYTLTDWLVEPLRRVLPPLGALDWSPLAAWVVLWILKALVLAVL